MDPKNPETIDPVRLAQILGGATVEPAPGADARKNPSVVIPQSPLSSFYHS